MEADPGVTQQVERGGGGVAVLTPLVPLRAQSRAFVGGWLWYLRLLAVWTVCV